MPPLRTFRDCEADRSNNFDALRVGFALLVIVSHSYPLIQGSNDREPLSLLTGGQLTFGEVAVDGFFLISGYLITASWQRSRGTFDYLRRRVLRIYPGFLVSVAFCSFVAAPLLMPDASGYWREFDLRRWAFEAFNLQGAYSPEVQTNGSLWSIRYEFLCYLGVAVLGMLGLLRRPLPVLALILACSGVQIVQIYSGFQLPGSRLSWLWCYPDFWPRLAACYLAGAAFHLPEDMPRCIPHRDPQGGVHRHTVVMEAGTRLEEIYGPGEIRVNSYHHQGIRKLAPNFRVAAVAPDGLIEAYEGKDHSWWVTGVQWHPENEGAISLDTQLIEAFTEAAASSKMAPALAKVG